MFSKIFNFLNKAPIWKIPINIDGESFIPNSFDRMAALLLHKKLSGVNSFTRWIQENGKPGCVVLDIGANQGLFSVTASKVVGPHGLVHAFEPDQDLAESLVNNIKNNGIQNVKVHNFALGAQVGSLSFFRNPYNSGDNRLTSANCIQDQFHGRVLVRPLDDLAEIPKFDFVKIDVQGWEIEVLRGMINKLNANSHAKILFEFWPHGMRIAGLDPLHLIHFMIDNSYALKECESKLILSKGNAPDFIKSITGKKYRDIEAVKIA
jgi:FkbM family methyltransferase